MEVLRLQHDLWEPRPAAEAQRAVLCGRPVGRPGLVVAAERPVG